MYFGKLYYVGIFPFLTNKKEIKPRSNIFKIDSVVSTKLSPDTSFIELLGRDSPFVEIDEDPVLSLCLISMTSTLLDKFFTFFNISWSEDSQYRTTKKKKKKKKKKKFK